MNTAAERHLAKAEGYLAKGDNWYGKAADEIIAAQKADPTISQREIGEKFGKSQKWVARLVAWRTSESPATHPIDWERGSHSTKAEIEAGVKKTLIEAPFEVVETILMDLPAKRAAKIARLSLEKPGVTREMAKDPESSAAVTRASGQVREEMVARNKERTRKARKEATGGISGAAVTIGELVHVIGPLVQAKHNLRESYNGVREFEISDDVREAVVEELAEVRQIVDWYESFIESGDQSFEDELSKLLADDEERKEV